MVGAAIKAAPTPSGYAKPGGYSRTPFTYSR